MHTLTVFILFGLARPASADLNQNLISLRNCATAVQFDLETREKVAKRGGKQSLFLGGQGELTEIRRQTIIAKSPNATCGLPFYVIRCEPDASCIKATLIKYESSRDIADEPKILGRIDGVLVSNPINCTRQTSALTEVGKVSPQMIKAPRGSTGKVDLTSFRASGENEVVSALKVQLREAYAAMSFGNFRQIFGDKAASRAQDLAACSEFLTTEQVDEVKRHLPSQAKMPPKGPATR